MKEPRNKAAIAAVFAAALAIEGCSGRDPQDFLARAPDALVQAARAKNREAICARITHHAKLNKIPESLIHRVVQRESKYDPTLRHGPYWGLMQIRHDTAKSMGYSGPPIGLLDPETNLTYAVAYLANAYRVRRRRREARATALHARLLLRGQAARPAWPAAPGSRRWTLFSARGERGAGSGSSGRSGGHGGPERRASRRRGASLRGPGSVRARAQFRQRGKPS